MTLRDMMDAGVILQGQIKLQCWGNKDYPDVYYEGNLEVDPISVIEKYLDREITYIFPYVVNIGGVIDGRVSVGAICIELEEED